MKAGAAGSFLPVGRLGAPRGLRGALSRVGRKLGGAPGTGRFLPVFNFPRKLPARPRPRPSACSAGRAGPQGGGQSARGARAGRGRAGRAGRRPGPLRARQRCPVRPAEAAGAVDAEGAPPRRPGAQAAAMRVNEKYSTLPAEDRSVHIINICAIEDIGYLPSEGTVSAAAAPGAWGRGARPGTPRRPLPRRPLAVGAGSGGGGGSRVAATLWRQPRPPGVGPSGCASPSPARAPGSPERARGSPRAAHGDAGVSPLLPARSRPQPAPRGSGSRPRGPAPAVHVLGGSSPESATPAILSGPDSGVTAIPGGQNWAVRGFGES